MPTLACSHVGGNTPPPRTQSGRLPVGVIPTAPWSIAAIIGSLCMIAPVAVPPWARLWTHDLLWWCGLVILSLCVLSIVLHHLAWRTHATIAGRIASGLCPACAYSPPASAQRCPECGHTLSDFTQDKGVCRARMCDGHVVRISMAVVYLVAASSGVGVGLVTMHARGVPVALEPLAMVARAPPIPSSTDTTSPQLPGPWIRTIPGTRATLRWPAHEVNPSSTCRIAIFDPQGPSPLPHDPAEFEVVACAVPDASQDTQAFTWTLAMSPRSTMEELTLDETLAGTFGTLTATEVIRTIRHSLSQPHPDNGASGIRFHWQAAPSVAVQTSHHMIVGGAIGIALTLIATRLSRHRQSHGVHLNGTAPALTPSHPTPTPGSTTSSPPRQYPPPL